MGSDVRLLIYEPELGAIVVDHWLGMNGSVEAVRTTLQRKPDASRLGWESWGGVTSDQARAINQASYADGPSPQDLEGWARQYPSDRCWWIVTRDY